MSNSRGRPDSRSLTPLLRPLQEFLSAEASGGIVLLGATIAGLAWVNAPFGGSYADVWSWKLTGGLDAVDLDLSLRQWINDALMAVFFFVVGLEIKREVLRGELSQRRQAALPLAAAVGGMIVPAAIYLAFNLGGEGERGWGVPIATDIAFAVGALSLLGSRVPLSLKVFLLALAIVDDIGAIAVIALFYSGGIELPWLGAAIGIFALVFVLGRTRQQPLLLYVLLGLAGWFAVHESGVHATIAGVTLGLLTPGEAKGTQREPLLDRLEHALHPWTSFVVIPLFALANAGIELDSGTVSDAVSSPVTAGVAAGLVIGKPLGIVLFAWIAVRSRVASLPAGVGWGAIAAVALVAGIGFTVSLFVAEIAFDNEQLARDARAGILAGSAIMAVAGLSALYVALRRTSGAQAPDSG